MGDGAGSVAYIAFEVLSVVGLGVYVQGQGAVDLCLYCWELVFGCVVA